MANEATNIVLLGNQGDCVEVIVLDAGAIPKGTLMQLTSSPQTCTATSGVGQKFIGILKEEKKALDGQVKVAVITHCLADMTCGAAESMVLGALVKTGAVANEVTVSDGCEVQHSQVGIAQETVAGGASGAVLINVGHQY